MLNAEKKNIRGSLFASLLASESDLLKEITPKNLHSSLQALGHCASEESRQPEGQSISLGKRPEQGACISWLWLEAGLFCR